MNIIIHVLLCSVTLNFLQPHGLHPAGILQTRILSGLPFLSLLDLPDPGIEPVSPAWQAVSLLLHQLRSHKLR